MIDLTRASYRVAVMAEDGKQYNIKEHIQNLGWEENENEIAVRTSFTAKNDKTDQGYLSSIIKPGCLVGVFASVGGAQDEEVARGYVESWSPSESNGGLRLMCTCYDEMYKLQKSQDNRYYPSGTGTQSAIEGVLDDWGIPHDDYKGPNVSHGKQVFNSKYLSDIILEMLDDAAKKGGGKCIIRASKGMASVIPRGSNKDVYVFRPDNSQTVSHTLDASSLVTRVKVVGKEDDDGKRNVEATLDGLTRYGVRQRIYTRGTDESMEDAKAAAQEILDTDGRIKEELTVESPDVPFIRKGDLVYIISSTTDGYYYVKGIQHNAESYSMTMTVEAADTQEAAAESGGAGKKGYKVGDVVDFHGGTHYVSSYPGAKGYAARAGQAKITKDPNSGNNGKAHPWHLVHTDGGSNVYGWVDDGSFD